MGGMKLVDSVQNQVIEALQSDQQNRKALQEMPIILEEEVKEEFEKDFDFKYEDA